MAEDREAKIAELFQNVNKKYGKGSMLLAKDFKFGEVQRITTGIFALDHALGGGFPVGRISMVYGHKSSGKTTTLLRTIGRAQRSCSNCWEPYTIEDDGTKKCPCGKFRETKVAWLDVEGVWDESWASRFLNLEELIFQQPEYAEQAIDVADSLVRSGAVDIIVVDSIAFLTPSIEIENSAEKANVGTQARLVGNAMRKFVSGTNEVGRTEGRRPTILLTNQIRNKVGIMFGNPETTPGGLAAGFATSVEVRFTAGKADMDEETGNNMSMEFKFRVEKNKVGPAKMEGEFTQVETATEVKKPGEILDEPHVVTMADRVGLIKIGRGTCTYRGEKFDGTRSELERHLMIHPEEYEQLKKELLKVLTQV